MAKGPQKGWQSADDLFAKYRLSFLIVIVFGTISLFVILLLMSRDSLSTANINIILIITVAFFAVMYAMTRGVGRGLMPNTWMKVDKPPNEVAAVIEQALEQEGVPNARHTFKGYARDGRNQAVLKGIQGLPAELKGYVFDLWDGERVITVSPEPPRGSVTDIVIHPRRGKYNEVMDRVQARIEIPFMEGHRNP